MARVCGVCKRKESLAGDGRAELRPYGKGGSLICYDCAMKPEHVAEANAQFGKAFEAAASTGGPVILTKDGPKPLP